MRHALGLHQSGRIHEAEAVYAQVLAHRPSHPAALHFLGLLLHQTGRSAEGIALMERSLRARPSDPDFLNNLGIVQRELGRLAAAVQSFRKAVAERPDHLAARDSLGVTQMQLGAFEAAEKTFRDTLARRPDHLPAHAGAAEALREAGRTGDAIASYRAALERWPRNAELLHGLGVTIMQMGDLGQAADLFRAALAADPGLAKAWLMLSQVKRYTAPDAELRTMAERHAAAPPAGSDRMQLSFALGKAHDDLGDYARALAYYREGNAIRRKAIDYDPGRVREEFEAIKAAFDRRLFEAKRGSGIEDDTPIFVVGMPRSGTTLIEQIIASHPQVAGAGELHILKSAVARAFPTSAGFPNGIGGMSQTALAAAGRHYLEMLRERFPGQRHVTDKMPGNFMLVGFIHLMLPRAKIVHCVRNPVATCLSIYKVLFGNEGHAYAYDLETLADFHSLYADMMDHWNTVLPGVVHDVRYEDFVVDQEGQSRALMEHLGLPWDDAVLAFHTADRPVRTASAAQVRQPMYSGSVDLWRRYGDALKPLIDRLR